MTTETTNRRGTPPTSGKTRITIYLDDRILHAVRLRSGVAGVGYQTMINDILAQAIGLREKPVTLEQVREIVRREVSSALGDSAHG